MSGHAVARITLVILVAVGINMSTAYAQPVAPQPKAENDKNECIWIKREYKLLLDEQDSNIDHQRQWSQNASTAKKYQQQANDSGNPDLASSWDSDIQFANHQIDTLKKEDDEKLTPHLKELRKRINLCDNQTAMTSGPEGPHHGATMLVGLVVPADRRPGDVCTARLVANPDGYADIPGLAVERVSVPEHKNKRGHAELDGLVVATNRAKRVPADGPVPFDVPITMAMPPIEVALIDVPTETTDIRVPEPVAPPTEKTTPPAEPTMAPLIPDSGVSRAHGKFSGDGAAMRIKVGDTPAPVIAANPREVFFKPSSDTPVGENQATITDAGVTDTFKLWSDKVSIKADKTVLDARGDSTKFQVTIAGLPDRAEDWKPAAGAGYAGKGGGAAASEGAIVLTIKNDSPGVGTITEGNVMTRTLHFADCPGGTCTVGGTFVANEPGSFQVEASISPQLGDIAGMRSVIGKDTATPAPKGCCQYWNPASGNWCTIETENECLGSGRARLSASRTANANDGIDSGWQAPARCYAFSSVSSALASFRSAVSKPSVKQA